MGISITPMGLRQAAAALHNLERKQEVVANNLANVSTAGFKGERTFAYLLEGLDVPAIGTSTDRRQGALNTTGAPLDLSLAGDGFFVVETPTGEQLTRGGTWRFDTTGQLLDAAGAPVLGEYDPLGGTRGPVVIPPDAVEIRITGEGVVFADGVQRARLRVEQVPETEPLQHAGDGRFAAPPSRTSIEPAGRAVRQGATEESNVGSVDSLVALIDIQRAYASVQKAVTTIDGARAIVAGDLAKPI